MSRETRGDRAEMGFHFQAGPENRSRLRGPDKWSAERGTFRFMAKQSAAISWAAERSSLSVLIDGKVFHDIGLYMRKIFPHMSIFCLKYGKISIES